MTEGRSNLPRSSQNVIAVRVTDEEYAIIRAGAAADSRKVADYVRVHMLARAITDATRGRPESGVRIWEGH